MTATAEATPVAVATPPAVVPRERGRLATWWSDTLVFAGRNLEHIRQIPEKLLDVTLQPLMFVLLFAYVFGGAIAVQGGSYREFLIGGILIQSLAFGLAGPATAIATAQATPNWATSGMPAKANPMNTAIMISAALVIVRALVLTP